MTDSVSKVRALLIFGICVPLALFIGLMVSNPENIRNLGTISLIVFILILPLLLRWHHFLLIAAWNMSLGFLFLPGQPPAWWLLAGISFVIALGQYILNRQMRFVHNPSVTWSLLFFLLVVLITIKLTGFGVKATGSDTFGGKRYISIFAAILAYFALTSQTIPPNRRMLYVGIYLAGEATNLIGTLAAFVSSKFYFIFLFFQPDTYSYMAMADQSVFGNAVARWSGVGFAGTALVLVMLARYGVREILNPRKFWRLGLFGILLFASLLGGFRSLLIMIVLIFAILYCLEGLVRSRLSAVLCVTLLLGAVICFPLVRRLPMPVQRSLSFVPGLPISPIAKWDAESSSDWRLKIWKDMIPQIPRYLLVGKGFAIDSDTMALLQGGGTQGQYSTEIAELTGDYHNGPLSVILSFGIFGVIGFLWFLAASFRVMLRNFRYGEPESRHLNAFLLAYFVAKLIYFFAVYGAIYSDLPTFVSLVALSLSLNGGVAKKTAPASQPQPEFVPAQTVPVRRRILPAT